MQVKVRALIRHGDKIVVARESVRGLPRVSLPGGRPRAGEELLEALAREVREETGLEIHAGRLLYVAESVNSHAVQDLTSSSPPRPSGPWTSPRSTSSTRVRRTRPTSCRRSSTLRAFYDRVRARRGAQVAAVATARKLASLFWYLLTREQDYAFGQRSLTRRKVRKLELAAGAPSRKGQVRAGDGLRNKQIRDAERALAAQAEDAYRRTIADWEGNQAGEGGRERDIGTRISKALEGQSRAADHKSLTSALRYVNRPRPHEESHSRRHPDQAHLDFPSVVRSCA